MIFLYVQILYVERSINYYELNSPITKNYACQTWILFTKCIFSLLMTIESS